MPLFRPTPATGGSSSTRSSSLLQSPYGLTGEVRTAAELAPKIFSSGQRFTPGRTCLLKTGQNFQRNIRDGGLQVRVIGFAQFLLDAYSTQHGQGVVTGSFVQYVGAPPDGQNPAP